MNSDSSATVSPAIECVFMTGYAEDAFDNHDFPDAGANVILKPFRKFDFATVVRKALDETQPPA